MNKYSKYDNIIMNLYEQGVSLGELIVWYEVSCQLDDIDDYNIVDDKKEKMCDTYITYDKKNKLWLVCDDSTEQKWVEIFHNLDTAIKWVKGEYDL